MTSWVDKYLDPSDEELFERIADETFGPKRGRSLP